MARVLTVNGLDKMKYQLLFLALINALVAADSVSTYSQEICRTKLLPQKGASGTTTKTNLINLTRTIKATVTPTSTVTPKSATVSTTSTSIVSTTKTLPQTTNTFSETVSITQISTVSTTLVFTTTSTAFQTTTSTFDTTTIAASTGFVPLSSALAAQGHVASKKHKRGLNVAMDADAVLEQRAVAQKIVCGSDGSITFSPPAYTGAVTCYKQVQVVTTKTVTSTARTTRTVTAPQGTITSTIYTTQTTTLTETPIAASTTTTLSVTQTITTTTSLSSTLTVPYTSTSTIYAPQPTFYAGCATSNIVSFVDNKRIFNIAVADPNNGFSFGNKSSTAYDCCVQCVLSGTCGGTSFHPASGTCYMFPSVGTTCNPTSQSGTFATQSGTNVGFVLSNSNCGEVALLA